MTGDEFGYSPDIGKFVIRGDKIYSEYGCVYERGGMFRSMPRGADSHENYADWTEQQRAAKLDEALRNQEEEQNRRNIKRDARRILVAQAEKKLTKEEFEAVLGHNESEDRGL